MCPGRCGRGGCTADDYLYWLFSAIAVAKNSGYLADDAAWEEKIGDTPTAEYLKESALENSKLYAVALAKAEEEDVARLAREGLDHAYGARPLRRLIRSRVEDPAAEALLAGRVGRGDTLVLSAGENGLAIGPRVG